MYPLVTICCQTYNHEKFITECLNGFISQKANFDYEILIHDDASTDGTAIIVKEFEEKFPDLFRCVYQQENQFEKQNTLTNILFPMSRGKYIALCEGDDCWTDSHKLQKQVDFLEKNPEYSFCHHLVNWVDSLGNALNNQPSNRNVPLDLDIQKAIFSGGGCFATASLMFTSDCIKEYPTKFSKYKSGDTVLLLLMSLKGRGRLLPFVGANYRIHDGGFNTSVQNNVDKRLEWQADNLELLNAFDQYTNGMYSKYILRAKYKEIVKMLRLQSLSWYKSIKFSLLWSSELSIFFRVLLLSRTIVRKFD